MEKKDFYQVLGVPKTAAKKEIDKAFRKLARKHHPDVNPGNKKAEEKFKEIAEAHDVLSDEQKRKNYDEFGQDALRAGFDPEASRRYRSWHSSSEQPTWEDFGGEAEGRSYSFEDLFGGVFSRSGGRTGRRRPQSGNDLESRLSLDFIEAIKGVTTRISLNRLQPCSVCGASGLDPGVTGDTCPECQGTGQANVGDGPVKFMRACPRCSGSGRINQKPCTACRGLGQLEETEQLSVTIPPGVDNGSKVRVTGKGEPGQHGGPPGNLYLIIEINPHPLITRKGDDLYLQVPITLFEAVAGGTVTVPTPSGQVNLKIPRGAQSGQRLRLKGKGVKNPKTQTTGDFYAEIMIKAPPVTDEQTLGLLKDTEALYETHPRAHLHL
ncbi:MAG: molecular chaperone DnaJ [Deltaproteobacteria bacterium]|nr:molecular chaperone DnaJ [Deltaproteobacteria bacterium]